MYCELQYSYAWTVHSDAVEVNTLSMLLPSSTFIATEGGKQLELVLFDT
jgi:hypothetical protein